MIQAVRYTAAAAALMLLAGCSHTSRVPNDDGPQEYLVGGEDVLDISVWRDADLSRTVPVRPDGRIGLPLVGEIEAAGRSAKDIAAEIATRLAPYMQDPRVVVIVREVNAPRVFVVGEVHRPGAYPLRGRMSVLQALALAGGPNEFAETSEIVVLRSDTERYVVDYEELVTPGGRDFGLRPGDTIFVP